ncbi:PLxRFG domain-containing protein [Cupriavidus sp. UYPR2.512]|uniref:PLxRFG domain-containing protein n=1 Tax=Cupriavidus sp. UYPR2.512 TaxID=1080187 RepID=UPI0003A2C26B|nr:PLxRFG domain-containing protein [Cupriavidus sp. UYPR2.512]UIF90836.1 PLxRFG domain-containing protein [Cupriavidus necator]
MDQASNGNFLDQLRALGGAAPASAPAGTQSDGDARSNFIRDNSALAERVGADLDVDPDALIGQWGLETGWGKSVIPGTNNLGNIKDFSGKGAAATDNMTGSRDRYRQYASLDDFGNDYTGLIGRKYPGAIGSGSDPRRFATALKAGGYAEDPAYVDKMVAAAEAVKRIRGTLNPPKERPASVSYFNPAEQPGASPADFERDTRRTDAARAAGATVGDLAREFGASAVSGLGDMLGGAGEVAAAAANHLTGTEDYAGFNPLTKPAAALRSGMTEGGKLARQDGFDGDLMKPETWKAPDSVSGWLMTAANGLGSLAPSILPALGPAARAARLAAAGDAAGAAAASAAAKVTGAATGGLMTGGNAASDARQNVGQTLSKMTHDQLMADVPIYREAFDKTGDARTARNAVENAAAQYAGMGAGLMGAAGGAFNAKIIEDLIAHKGVSAVLGSISKRPTVRGVVGATAGAVGEGGQEVSEGVGQAMGENFALGRPVGQDVTRGSFGNFAGGAMVGGPMGGAGGVLSRAAGHAPAQPTVVPGVAPGAEAPGAVPPADGVVPPGAAAQPAEEVDPFTARIDKIREAFPTFMQGKDPTLRDEALYALTVATNPEARADLREQALTQLESIFSGAGNFTMPPGGGDDAGGGGALVPTRAPKQRAAGPGLPNEDLNTIEGEVREVPPPAPRLPGRPAARLPAPADMAERARYEQEFSDLVKTDQIDRSLAALESQARTLFQDSMREREGSARLAEIQQAIEHNRAERSRQDRARILSDVLADPAVENHEPRFAAELARAGFRDTAPTADELAKIDRFQGLREALMAPPEAIPSTPNELDPYAPARAPAAPAQPSDFAQRREAIRAAIAAGQTVEKRADGTYLVNPETGEARRLTPAEMQIARNELAKKVSTAAAETNTEPTEAQKENGNYKKARIKFHGLPIAIENPKGATRSGVDPDGNAWESTMVHHYGYVEGTDGADKDPVDVFIGPDATSKKVYVVDQIDPKTGAFDEHKALLGFTTEAAARKGYLDGYEDGWQGLGAITEMPIGEFKTWLKDGNTKQPIDPKAIRAGEGAATVNPAEVAQDEPEAPAATTYFFYGGPEEGFQPIPADKHPRAVTELKDLLPDFDFIVHESLKDNPAPEARYTLSEVSSGLALMHGPTAEATIEAARELIEKRGAEKIAKAIVASRDKSGAAPAPQVTGIQEQPNESRVGSGTDSGAGASVESNEDSGAEHEDAAQGTADADDAAGEAVRPGDSGVPAAGDAADGQPALSEKPLKWYGTKARAERHITENGLSDTHEVVNPAGTKRFEIRQKSNKSSDVSQEVESPTLRAAPDKEIDEDGAPQQVESTPEESVRPKAEAGTAQTAAEPLRQPKPLQSSNVDGEPQRLAAAFLAKEVTRLAEAGAPRDAGQAALDALGEGELQPARDYLAQHEPDGNRPYSEVRAEQMAKEAGRAQESAGDEPAPEGVSTEPQSTDASATTEPEPVSAKEEPEPAAVDGSRAPQPGKIEDFGEVLTGARKHYAQAYADAMKEAHGLDVAAHPLSKTWPDPDYNKLLDGGADPWAVAFARAARDAIPTKPQKGWKLSGWVSKVETLRAFAEDLLAGTVKPEAVREFMEGSRRQNGLGDILNNIDLYLAVGHAKSLKGLTLSAGHYSIFEGKHYDPAKTIWSVNREAKATAFGNWPRMLAMGDTKEEAIEAFRQAALAKVDEEPQKRAVSFAIYSTRGQKGFFIGKKIGKEVVRLHTGLSTAQEARAYLAEHQAELEERLAKLKETPDVRNAENAPRVGGDHRDGADVTPERFAESFGFRGVQFGNYVEGARRQQDLNNAYDALMDLAGVLDVPPRALSLNGELGLAFGARGSGGKNPSSAHYERGNVVINLTKGSGAGSLAHEWWHSLDSYFSRMRGDRLGMMTADQKGGEGVREEMRAAFAGVNRAISDTALRERSRELDKLRSKAYWTTPEEMSARAFESYVIAKLADQGAANDYLANIVSEDAFAREGAYPYPTAGEIPAIRAGFDHFFDTVETRETDDGNVAMFRSTPEEVGQDGGINAAGGASVNNEPRVSGADADNLFARLRAGFAKMPGVEIAASFEDLPDALQRDARAAGLNPKGVKGAFHGGKLYVVLSNHSTLEDLETTALHELVGHFGIRQLLGAEVGRRMNKLFAQLGGIKGLRAIAEQYGFGDTFEGYIDGMVRAQKADPARYGDEVIKALLSEELIAHIAQEKPTLRQRWKEFVGAIRDALRRLGLTQLAEYNDADLAHLIRTARKGLENGGPEGSPRGGQPAPAFRGTTQDAAFRRWFGDSKVVNPDGSPKVMYHGTQRDFSQFDTGRAREGSGHRSSDLGIFMTESPQVAALFAGQEPDQTTWPVRMGYKPGGNVMPVYASIANPVEIGAREFAARFVRGDESAATFRDRAIKDGHDGILIRGDESLGEQMGGDEYGADAWVAFRPEQIKSATGNNGNFDPANPDIRFRAEPAGDEPTLFRAAATGDQDAMANLRDRVRQQVSDTFTSQRTFNRWWHKTVGTQYHKAQVDPEGFGKVFNLAQQYIDDVARYASEAADRAEGLLPKLETAREAFKGLFTVRRDAADAKAIAKPIFDGTLNETIYSDDALRREFGLTKEQIDLYREFRAAVDKSLDDLAISEMGRLAKASKLQVAPKGMNLRQAAKFYFDQFADEIDVAESELADLKATQAQEVRALDQAGADTEADRNEYADQVAKMRKRHEAEIAPLQARVAELQKLRHGFEGKAEQIEDLKRKGYAPLTRFGQYTVDVFMAGEDGKPLRDADGEEIRPFFGMFETQAEANQAARALQEEYPNATVKQGVLSQNAYSLFKGVTPETVELMAQMMGAEQSDAFQRYLKTAVSNRSAMKRLIARKGIKGYSEDPTRVLAAFLTSNARAAAANDHMGDMLKAAAAIPKDRGDAKDEAVNLLSYLQNPGEEASKLRGLLFVNYIGGSIASALVNMTQTVTMTYPYLHQFGGNTAGMVGEAMRLAGRRLRNRDTEIADPALRAALERATDEGVTSPHEIHMLYGESSRTGMIQGNRYMRNFLKAFGSFFSLAELYNRDVAFIAAYRVAQKQGMEGDAAYDFAKKAVEETQGVYSPANKPNWARGAVGSTLFTFKQFSISYLEFLKRLPAKERAIALGILVLFAGMQGMPGADDLDDVIDTIAQSLGYSTGTKEWKRELVANVFGKDAAGFVQYGVSYGLPIDIAGRMSVGNLIPGTAIFKKSTTDKSKEVSEVFGAAGGLAEQIAQAAGLAQNGQLGAAALAMSPKAFRDMAKGIDMVSTKTYSDSKDRKVADASALDGVFKAIGFQPAHIAESGRQRGEVIQKANLARAVESEIAGRWAKGVAKKDPAAIADARQALVEWNLQNPEAPIKIKLSQVQRRARDMQSTSEDRLIKSVPKEMRRQAEVALAD